MYIENDNIKSAQLDIGNNGETLLVSPETPPWGPPSGSGTQRPPVVIVPGQPVRPNTGFSSIRFLYAATGQPPVNVWLGNRVVIRNMQFGNSTPYYQDNASRNREIRIVNAHTGDTLYQGTFTFLSGKAYTVPIINEGSNISVMSLEDEPCSVSYAGCIRAVNLSPDSGPVDIFMSRIGRVFQNVDPFEVTDY